MRIRKIGVGVIAAVAIGLWTGAAAADFACGDESGLCVESGDATWAGGTHTTSKDRKKRSSKTPGSISMTIDGGRGSLFVNGRYAGTAPLDGISVPSGPNDIQVRDGSTVLADGVLTVPAGGDVAFVVRHD